MAIDNVCSDYDKRYYYKLFQVCFKFALNFAEFCTTIIQKGNHRMEPKSTPVDRRPDTNAGSASPPHFLTRHEINIDKYDNVGPPEFVQLLSVSRICLIYVQCLTKVCPFPTFV